MKIAKWLSLLIINFIILFSHNSYASGDIYIYIDGEKQNFTPPPIISDGTTLVPMRQCFEALGAIINWDDSTKSVLALRDNTKVKITIGSLDAYVNGVEKTLSVAPKIIGDKTYIPLRFISESLGAKVFWEGNFRTITIIDKLDDTIKIVDSQNYKMRTEYHFINEGDEVDSDFDVLIGSESNSPYQQDSFVKIFPEPYEYHIDSYGNTIAKIKVNNIKPNQKVDIIVEKILKNSGISYSIDEQNIINKYQDISAYDTYLSPQNYIESDNNLIVSMAKKLSLNDENPLSIAKNVYSFVNLHMTYDTSELYARKGALNALISARGVCEDYSKLFVALLRANDIPSRSVVGFWLTDETKNQMSYNEWYDAEALAHEWPEFYLEGYGWIIAEPTYTYTINGKKVVPWDQFANQDENGHILFGYEPDDENSIKWSISGYGKLNLEYSDMKSLIMKVQ